MTTGSRYPARFLILAGLAGAMAWSLPYLMAPFTRLITFWLAIPVYVSPPYRIQLGERVIGYFLAGILAGGILLLGLRYLPINRERFTRPRLSRALALAVPAGMGIGGALAIFFSLGFGYSQQGYSLFFTLDRLFPDFFGELPEPYLSIGLTFGAALAVALSGLGARIGIRRALIAALKVSWRVLVVRLILFVIEYSSLVKYTLGNTPNTFIIFEMAAGLLAGMWVWGVCASGMPE